MSGKVGRLVYAHSYLYETVQEDLLASFFRYVLFVSVGIMDRKSKLFAVTGENSVC